MSTIDTTKGTGNFTDRPLLFCRVFCVLFIVLLYASVGQVSAASAPMITGLSPSGGPLAGGTVVAITGSGFTGTTDVQFGGKSGTSMWIVNDSQLTIIAPSNPEGIVVISVITPAGVGVSTGPSAMYEYDKFPFPRLSTVSPSSGTGAGGTLVTLTGSGFTGTESVYFGLCDGSLKVVDDSHLTVITPPSLPGSVPISITNAHGIGRSLEPATMYIYEFPIPELTNVSPSSGSIAGGTIVTITGSGFTGTTDVLFGGKSGTDLKIVDNRQLTIITPPNPEGVVAISVINPAGTGGSLGSATVFHYEIPVPKLTGISPSAGTMEGGTLVTLTGSGFTGTKNVLFGGKPVTSLSVINDSHLTVITPASSSGQFPISITNAYGEGGSLGPSTLFQYVITPVPTTIAIKTATLDQGYSGGRNASPAVSSQASSPAPAAAPAAASGTQKTPGFEAIFCFSALGAIILLGKSRP